MQNDLRRDEIVHAIQVPLPSDDIFFRTYKVAKRFDSDISAVCGAYAIKLDENKIVAATIAYGGMAAVPKRALSCEQALAGQAWSEETVQTAKLAIANDFQPLSDMRASADNRLASAQNLLYRFYLETRPIDPLPADAVNVYAVV